MNRGGDEKIGNRGGDGMRGDEREGMGGGGKIRTKGKWQRGGKRTKELR